MTTLKWAGVPLMGAVLIAVGMLMMEPDTLSRGWPVWLAFGSGALVVAGWGIVAVATACLRRVSWWLPVALAGLGAGIFILGAWWAAPIADEPYVLHPVIAVNLLGFGLGFGAFVSALGQLRARER